MQAISFDEEVAMKAAQAAAIAAAAQQQQQKQKELLWEDQACTRCGSKVGQNALRPTVYLRQVLLLLTCHSDHRGQQMGKIQHFLQWCGMPTAGGWA
jgi:hypothetical protein